MWARPKENTCVYIYSGKLARCDGVDNLHHYTRLLDYKFFHFSQNLHFCQKIKHSSSKFSI
ncbi:hypothetical protein HanXRQr2_Chr16g0729951 [Helianthus annuus]|uniref:Uncharacterized protein n=1 Tax=Helianthus annuus TaxID=4232 RepID=A0A9K3GWI1_HELAN|nr:hypothetical protein HanXRQr2_Chr16g0729951 [Helianthus annuus]KAJ0819768.1 hypothetical protein HanPSC8_Chr16g0699881 [Helianthus annuus]